MHTCLDKRETIRQEPEALTEPSLQFKQHISASCGCKDNLPSTSWARSMLWCPPKNAPSAVVTVGRRKISIMRSEALVITTSPFSHLCHCGLICMSGTHRFLLPAAGRSVSLKSSRIKTLKNLSCWVREGKGLVSRSVRRLDANSRAHNGFGSKIKSLRAYKKGMSKNRGAWEEIKA